MRIPWLGEDDGPQSLPPAGSALAEPNGLVAAGGALTPDWLIHAYRHGIFPWYTRGQPILWWSPDPRCVLWPGSFRRTRSLEKSIRNRGYETRVNVDFAAVLDGCAAPRDGEPGTWITPEMRRSYLELHGLGWAHSVETWAEGRLVGGLYGVQVGGLFFGESMFTRERDASKVAFAALVDRCEAAGIELIDCQLHTGHLASLGAVTIPRAEFLSHVARLAAAAWPPGARPTLGTR
ncbi:MAG: leucyl/phenylalanyl-tRNA--protein transferase [Steroidobacteraceae bacterium]|jgi:leucyl/phenylalanyl-tRNA--protein transferase|nr:leucyl/phenylalanyl-tRNA--protein transferase [Steroidobacteraceae bacterium]